MPSRRRAQVDAVVGDGRPGVEQVKALRLTTRVINEAMRLYPQPPVLIRRALGPDTLAGFHLPAGADIFISVWNLHRSDARPRQPPALRPRAPPACVRMDRERTQAGACAARPPHAALVPWRAGAALPERRQTDAPIRGIRARAAPTAPTARRPRRSPEYWDRPNSFDPDRFPLDAPVPTEVTENFAYLPFGGGKRKCIGAPRSAPCGGRLAAGACVAWSRSRAGAQAATGPGGTGVAPQAAGCRRRRPEACAAAAQGTSSRCSSRWWRWRCSCGASSSAWPPTRRRWA